MPHTDTTTRRTRADGWTAARQKRFLVSLAETGSVTTAAAECGLSARSAYNLRARADAPAFAAGWDNALRIATGRLTAVAFERALKGSVRQVWKDGELVASTREPSDRLIMFLLNHLVHPKYEPNTFSHIQGVGQASLGHMPDALTRLTDSDCPAEFITHEDMMGEPIDAPVEEEMPDADD